MGVGCGAESAFSSPKMLLCACSCCPLLPLLPALEGNLGSGEGCLSGPWEGLGAAGWQPGPLWGLSASQGS